MLSAYLAELSARGCTEKYVRSTDAALRRFGGADAGELLQGVARKATQATVNDYLRRLTIYRNWLLENGQECPYGPLGRIKARRASVPRAVFTVEEVRKLTTCEGIPPERRALWSVLARTGLRPVEASRIEAEHVVKVGRRWELRLPGECQKSGRSDSMPLTEGEAQLILKNLPLVRRAVGHLDRPFKKDLAAAGIPLKQGKAVRRVYDLRSFYLTLLLDSGVDIGTIQELARHRSIATTLKHYNRHAKGHAHKRRTEVLAAALG